MLAALILAHPMPPAQPRIPTVLPNTPVTPARPQAPASAAGTPSGRDGDMMDADAPSSRSRSSLGGAAGAAAAAALTVSGRSLLKNSDSWATRVKATLVVVTRAIKPQWMAELQRWAPGLRVLSFPEDFLTLPEADAGSGKGKGAQGVPKLCEPHEARGPSVAAVLPC